MSRQLFHQNNREGGLFNLTTSAATGVNFFVERWNNDYSINDPLKEVRVDWGDGSLPETYNASSMLHTYTASTVKNLSIDFGNLNEVHTLDIDGNVLKPHNSFWDKQRLDSQQKTMYLGDGPYNGELGYLVDGIWYFDYQIGARYGLNTETANINPTFSINKKGGVINFNSGMAGKLVVLEYISDGMENGDDSSISVNKLFEDFIYAYIKYAILNGRFGVQEYIVNRARKDKSSLLRNAKLRLSNIHPGRLLQNLRGQDKWLK